MPKIRRTSKNTFQTDVETPHGTRPSHCKATTTKRKAWGKQLLTLNLTQTISGHDSFLHKRHLWKHNNAFRGNPPSYCLLVLACCTTTDRVSVKYANKLFWSSNSSPGMRFRNCDMLIQSEQEKYDMIPETYAFCNTFVFNCRLLRD